MKDEVVKKRIDEAIHYLIVKGKIDSDDVLQGISRKLRRNKQNVCSALSGDRRYFTSKFANDFCEAYEYIISPAWLLYGNGEMVKEKQDRPYSPMIKYLPEDFEQKFKPRLPESASNGHIEEYTGGSLINECELLPLEIRFPEYDFTMFVRGNSMKPKYESGDEIALKKSTILEWGKDYLLDTDDGIMFKKIYDAGDSIRCVSYNSEEYPDLLIPKSSIRCYYKFVGLIRI